MLVRGNRISTKLDAEAKARLLFSCQELELGSFRLLNKWLPKVQEWELKVGLGKQIWQEAQHVDALWMRRSELLQNAEAPKPNPRVSELVSIVGNHACTACFLVGLYSVVKPRLLERYQHHVRSAEMADAPTVRALETIIREEIAQVTWGADVIARLGAERSCGFEETKKKSMTDYLTAEYGEPAPRALQESPRVQVATARTQRGTLRVGAAAGPPEVDARYTVLSLGDEQVSPEPGNTTDAILWRLHRLATREMLAAEIVARSTAEYPDMPWEFMLDMARICRDRVRRAELRRQHIEELGGRLGTYPIHPADWALYQHRVRLDLAYRLCDLVLLGEGPLENDLAAIGGAKGDSLAAATHPSRRLDEPYGQADPQAHLRSPVRWLNWLTADRGKLHQMIERGHKLRAKAALGGIPPGDPVTEQGGYS
jgi:uncharacterized ferritin-like protein (DUF455 family)